HGDSGSGNTTPDRTSRHPATAIDAGTCAAPAPGCAPRCNGPAAFAASATTRRDRAAACTAHPAADRSDAPTFAVSPTADPAPPPAATSATRRGSAAVFAVDPGANRDSAPAFAAHSAAAPSSTGVFAIDATGRGHAFGASGPAQAAARAPSGLESI